MGRQVNSLRCVVIVLEDGREFLLETPLIVSLGLSMENGGPLKETTFLMDMTLRIPSVVVQAMTQSPAELPPPPAIALPSGGILIEGNAE